MDRRRFLALGASSLLAAGCTDSQPSFHAIDVTGLDYARDFSLPDAQGQVRSLKDFRGKVVVVFFGYTQCPDVCPTTLSELAQVKKLLGADGEKLQGIFVTVDPERDTPEILKAYMGNFDPGFVALRPASAQQLEALAKDYRILYRQVPGKAPGSYTMDHTAASFVYDPQGRLRLYTRPGAGPQALADDIRQLLKAA